MFFNANSQDPFGCNAVIFRLGYVLFVKITVSEFPIKNGFNKEGGSITTMT